MNLQKLAVEKIEQAYRLAEKHYSTSFPRATIEFSNKLTSTAGKAYFHRNHIVLSTQLLELNKEKFLKDTPGHEAAHLIAYQLFGRAGIGHGTKWKQVMSSIGQPATRTHSMITPKKANRVAARCACTTHQITTTRANRMKRGTATYTCNKCKTKLELGTVRAVRKEPTKTTAPLKAKMSKADVVRYLIAEYKKCDMTLSHTLNDTRALEFVMSKANMSKSLATTYLKNNWDKVA